MTMIMATHSVDLLPLFADRLYVLEDGKFVGSGTPDHVSSADTLVNGASLRLPYVSTLVHELKDSDSSPLQGVPPTLVEARRRLQALTTHANMLRRNMGSSLRIELSTRFIGEEPFRL